MKATFVSQNPFNGELLQTFPTLSGSAIEYSIAQAQKAQQLWLTQDAAAKTGAILRLAEQLIAERQLLAETITLEMGKPLQQSEAEVDKCVRICQYAVEQLEGLHQPVVVNTEHHATYYRYEPLGLLLAIMPWNFPLWQALRFIVPALAGGNGVLLKPAPNVPQCALQLERLIKQAGFPEGLMTVVLTEPEDTIGIIAHRDIRGVTLTGSTKAGSAVAAAAGKAIKPCVLELGGSDALVVLEDADLVQAANAAIASRFNNSGQTCIAAKRFIVQEAVAEEFLELLLPLFAALNIGDPMYNPAIGPLARLDLAQGLQQQLSESIRLGARVIYEGGHSRGNFFSPTLLTDIPTASPAYQQELFGPIATLFQVSTEEQAISLANDTTFGLGAAIWSKDLDKATRLGARLAVGHVAINDIVRSDPRLPFGGVKDSGFGRELGLHGLQQFMNIKTYVVEQ